MFQTSRALHLDFRLREVSSDLMLTDDLQIHLLQLNNLRVTVENVYHASSAERWAFFLQNADELTPIEIRRMFPDEEIVEAAGVLEMISQTPDQLQHYNARLKFMRDEEARLRKAEEDGRKLGFREGERVGEARGQRLGRITLLQELLGMHPLSAEEFAGLEETQLDQLEEQLQQQLRSRS